MRLRSSPSSGSVNRASRAAFVTTAAKVGGAGGCASSAGSGSPRAAANSSILTRVTSYGAVGAYALPAWSEVIGTCTRLGHDAAASGCPAGEDQRGRAGAERLDQGPAAFVRQAAQGVEQEPVGEEERAECDGGRETVQHLLEPGLAGAEGGPNLALAAVGQPRRQVRDGRVRVGPRRADGEEHGVLVA